MTRNLNFDVPASDGVGTAVDTSDLSLTKTIGVEGPFTGVVVIEAAAGGGFCQIASFTGPVNRTIEVVATQMRVRVQGLVSGTPVVTMSAEQTRIASASVAVPAGDGTGASTDITALSENTTVVVDGNFTGVLYLEYSSDDTNFEQAGRSFTRPGCYNLKIPASFVRVVRANTTVAGSVQVFIAAEGSGAGSGGYASNVELAQDTANLKTIYVRTTGDDVTGDGSLTNPYLTFERAWDDIPLFGAAGTLYRIDLTNMGTITLPARNQFRYFPQSFINNQLPYEFMPGVGINFDYLFPASNVGGINITADPTILQTITQGDITGTPTSAIGQFTIQTTLSLTPGALVGKQIWNQGAQGAVVVSNTATDLEISANSDFNFDPTNGDLLVTEPSARFAGTTAEFDVFAWINFIHIGFDISVVINGRLGCEIAGCEFTASQSILGRERVVDNILASHFSGNTVYMAGNGTLTRQGQFWYNNFFNGVASSPVFFPNKARVQYAVFQGCAPVAALTTNDGDDNGEPISQQFDRCVFRNGTSNGAIARGPQQIKYTDCDFDGNTSNGVLADDGAHVQVPGCVSTNPNGTHGVQASNSAKVEANGSTTVSGASGDYKCGNNAAVAGGGAGWGALSNETDLAAGAPELCRIYI